MWTPRNLKLSTSFNPDHVVMSEQGVQERTKYTPLRGPSVEDQHGRHVVVYPYHLVAAHQEVQDPVAEGGV
jgi:type II secretory pathway component PulC